MNKYDSTLLAQNNNPSEIQKADLDLLKKVNEVSYSLDTQISALSEIDVSMQSQINILKEYSYENEFLYVLNGNVQNGFITTVVAAGTVIQGTGVLNHPGIMRITSSTTTNSGAYVATLPSIAIQNVKNISAIYSPFVFTATVTTRFGIHNTLTSIAPTLGVYWEMVDATCVAKVIGTYGTYTSSTITLTAGLWYQFKIEIIGSVAYFYLYTDSGILINSFNIPITLSSTLNTACFISTKAGVVATQLVDIDILKLNLNVSRAI